MIKILYTILFVTILSNISYAQDEKYYYYKLERLEKNNYELSSKINYLEKKLDNLEKIQRELLKENIILKKDIQKELEKQQIIIRNLDEHSNKNINNSIETINDFNKELKLSQTINFTTLGMFLVVIISLIIYISISIKRITKEALDKENNKQVKEKVFEFNKELEKTMHSALKNIETNKVNNKNELSFKSLEDKALDFFKTGKYHESIDTYKKAISINKSNIDIYIALAHVYNHIGDYNLAIEVYDTAISFKPNSAELYNQKSITLMQSGDYNNALLSIENSIKIDPENYHYYNTKGIIYYSTKEYKKSIEMFNKSIELNPKFANAYHNRATSYLAINENDLAVKDFSKAIEFEGGLLKTGR